MTSSSSSVCCFTSTETIGTIREGESRTGGGCVCVWGGGGGDRGIIHISLHCHH